MWFKNLQIYKLPAPWAIERETLSESLSAGAFAPCGSQQFKSAGFAQTKNGEFVYAVGGQWLLSQSVEQRILPASVVNREVAERAELFESRQGYRPSRKLLREMKEQAIEELMPRAFTALKQTNVWIDPANGWLGIDAPSSAKAEEALELFYKTVDEFPAERIQSPVSPASAMTEWLLSGDAPSGFTLDQSCELAAIDGNKPKVRYTNLTLTDDTIAREIRAHIEAGMRPTRIDLTWDSRVSFVFTDKGEIKRLRFLDVLTETLEGQGEDADEIFDAEFTLMAGELARMLPALLEALI
jgi:recombination associated protein RdgC